MQLFFLSKEGPKQGRLDAIEAKHCTRVLRHKEGDLIYTIDGQGNMYEARIRTIQKDSVLLDLLTVHQEWGEHGNSICLAISPLRLKDRFEWLIEKSVELGVTEIIPIRCRRTDQYKSKFKPERITTLMSTAIKQCKRSRLPILHPLLPFEEWITTHTNGSQFIAWCEAETPFSSSADTLKSQSEITIMIGPEGDFTTAEVNLAIDRGAVPIALGKQRLRSETAALFALSQIKGWWEY